MRMPRCEDQQSLARQIVKVLRDAGHEALWAGGCVRDQLLGVTPKDYDVATSARPQEVVALFGKRQTLAIGAAFGVIAVRGGRGIAPVEVATFRTDGDYSDGRRPDNVAYSTAEEDALRRDFTINALFYDPIEKVVIDYVEGQADLASRVIRAVGDPRQRFTEDKLRLLRAVRFAATYDCRIESDTYAAIQSQASEIHVVSAERIGMELRRMLMSEQRRGALQLLEETGLLGHVLPEILQQSPQRREEIGQTLQAVRQPTLPTVLAALLRDVAERPQIGSICDRWRLSSHEKKRTQWLVETVDKVIMADRLPWADLQPLLVHDGTEELVELTGAIVGYAAPSVAHMREKLQLPVAQLNPKPLVTGDTLVAAGFSPGPRFAALLREIRRLQLAGELKTPEQALDWAKGQA